MSSTPELDPPNAVDPAPVSRLPLIAMGALVVFAVVVGVALGLRGPQEFEAGTPEAAVQDYLNAAMAADAPALLEALAPEVRNQCEDTLTNDLARQHDIGFSLDQVQIDGTIATVTVERRRSDGGDPFGGSHWNTVFDFDLRQDNPGDWKIIDAQWPWPVTRCFEAAS